MDPWASVMHVDYHLDGGTGAAKDCRHDMTMGPVLVGGHDASLKSLA